VWAKPTAGSERPHIVMDKENGRVCPERGILALACEREAGRPLSWGQKGQADRAVYGTKNKGLPGNSGAEMTMGEPPIISKRKERLSRSSCEKWTADGASVKRAGRFCQRAGGKPAGSNLAQQQRGKIYLRTAPSGTQGGKFSA